MIPKTTAIMAAAACASFVVVLIPGFAPAAGARAAIQAQPAVVHVPDCTESWPYRQAACLHDAREPGGRARQVRIVSLDRAAPAGSVRYAQ